jgi:hypothetical protein
MTHPGSSLPFFVRQKSLHLSLSLTPYAGLYFCPSFQNDFKTVLALYKLSKILAMVVGNFIFIKAVFFELFCWVGVYYGIYKSFYNESYLKNILLEFTPSIILLYSPSPHSQTSKGNLFKANHQNNKIFNKFRNKKNSLGTQYFVLFIGDNYKMLGNMRWITF